jgi:hypothetical protein
MIFDARAAAVDGGNVWEEDLKTTGTKHIDHALCKRLPLLPKMVPLPKAGSRHAIEGIITLLVFRKHASGNGGINSCLRPTPLPHDAQAVRETTPCHSSVPF